MSDYVPDPLRFTARALERMGGVVDVQGSRAEALLPESVFRTLQVPENVVLSAESVPDDQGVACGIGSPLLESLVERARKDVPFASARVDTPPTPESIVRALAEGYDIRNGVFTVQQVTRGTSDYLKVAFAWSIEADERHEALAFATFHPDDGGRPDAHVFDDVPSEAAQRGETPMFDPVKARAWIARLARDTVEPGLGPVVALIARRQARDYQRLNDYYGALIQEAAKLRRGRRPASESSPTRAKVDPEAIATKVAHLVQERDSRLADLEHRYRARVSVRIASIVALHIPTAQVSLHVRRRKREGTLVLRLPAGAKRFDRLPCAACDGWLSSPVLCDDQLHVLCERCAPDAGGRPRCGACGR